METYTKLYDSDKDGKEVGDLLLKREIVGGRFTGFDSKLVKKIHHEEEDISAEKYHQGIRYFKRYKTIYHIGDSSVRIEIQHELSKPRLFSRAQKTMFGFTHIEITAQTKEQVEESRSLLEEMVGIKLEQKHRSE